jgi:hypothetical protein
MALSLKLQSGSLRRASRRGPDLVYHSRTICEAWSCCAVRQIANFSEQAQMVILGLNFGHDGSVVVLKDGRVLADIFRERYVRRKHAGGIDRAVLDMALAEAGVEIAQIDACAVTPTQGIENASWTL